MFYGLVENNLKQANLHYMTEYSRKKQSQALARGIENINFQIILALSAKENKKA